MFSVGGREALDIFCLFTNADEFLKFNSRMTLKINTTKGTHNNNLL